MFDKTFAEPAALLLSAFGGTMSLVGSGGEILNNAIEGKTDAANIALTVGSELVDMYLRRISGGDTVKI